MESCLNNCEQWFKGQRRVTRCVEHVLECLFWFEEGSFIEN